MTGIDWKVFLRAFQSHWDYENHQGIGGDIAEWSLWQYLYQKRKEGSEKLFY